MWIQIWKLGIQWSGTLHTWSCKEGLTLSFQPWPRLPAELKNNSFNHVFKTRLYLNLMSYGFCYIMWKKDNLTSNLVMAISEDISDTKKKKAVKKNWHHTLLERNWYLTELLNYFNTIKKRKFASTVYQREMRTPFNELLSCIDLSQLISNSQNLITFTKIATNESKLRKW